MIDHISIGVRDYDRAVRFYESVLATVGLSKLIVRADTVGFGKTYPEFWLNRRSDLAPPRPNDGRHICLRAPNAEAVRAFHAAAVAAGGVSESDARVRPEYTPTYFAAFICDPEGNRIEVVTFLPSAPN